MARTIHIVLAPGIVFAAYSRADLAYAHARCLLGADVVSCELRDTLPNEIKSDIATDEWSDEHDTPVIAVEDIDEK